MNRTIKICFKDMDGNPQQYVVGKWGVEKIIEHRAAGEGDKWYYDVYVNGQKEVVRLFEFSLVEYVDENPDLLK